MMSLMLATSILVIAPVPQVEQVDVAFDQLSAGRNGEAIARLETTGAEAEGHPAGLINLGVAHARRGDEAEARRLFQRAAAMTQRYELETASGTWVDSRSLALKALAALDRGALGSASATRTARR
ncbi:hypothetical protein A6F68_00991 [Tsuneonella dongtanensis]|uniref:Tetratricopeptide repeat protein n=1 Tax=Tsuneonella dongtanensis TaxID=692370 RepID=A0A1B2ABJ5_9SPHN|nr:hypothetical protein [Tsuneonella dongtanensis]ANY19516.1 hypothetical protein A6F68_00991 [Tsuneonella dongtanensis]